MKSFQARANEFGWDQDGRILNVLLVKEKLTKVSVDTEQRAHDGERIQESTKNTYMDTKTRSAQDDRMIYKRVRSSLSQAAEGIKVTLHTDQFIINYIDDA